MGRCISIFIFFLSITYSALAQEYGFRQYNLRDGLPQAQIGRLTTDSYGRLWLGTYYGGISVFDGQSFHNINKSDGLLDDDIIYLTASQEGPTYVVTTNGISVIDAGNMHTYSLPVGLIPELYVAGHGAEFSEGKLWLATREKGVHYWTPDTLVQVTAEQGYTDQTTTSVTADSRGDIWFGTENGRLYKKEGDEYIFKDSLPTPGAIYSLTADGYDRWWLATTQGIFLYQYGKITEWLPATGVLDGIEVYRIALDQEGGIWVASSAGGVYLYERGTFYRFGEREGLTDYEVIDVFADEQGNVWVASDGAGLFRFGGRQFTYLTKINGLESETAYAMVEFGPDQYWLVTESPGVQRYENGQIRTYGTEMGLPSEEVNNVFEASDGTVWVATEQGMAWFDGQRFRPLLARGESSEDLNRAVMVAESPSGELWYSGYGWVSRWDGQTLKHWQVPDSLAFSDIIIDCIQPLKNGKVLIGVDKHVLSLNPATGAFAYFIPENIPLHSYYTMAIEEEGNILWLALLNFGLIRCEDGDLTYYTTKEGLTSNQLYTMYTDRHGHRWLGSEKGVDRLEFNDQDRLLEVRHYGLLEGFKGQEVQANAVLEASDGKLWFGTVEGIMIYNPRHDRPDLTPPFAYLKEIELFFESPNWQNTEYPLDSMVGLPEYLKLDYRQNHVTFRYAAIDLRFPQKVRYRHRLLPQQEAWSPPLSDGEAVFSSLPPGQYEFQVLAANHSGVWMPEDEPLSYSFVITPPFWQTTWFYILLIAGVSLAIFGLVRFRVQRLERTRHLLERMVEERTEELHQKNRKLEDTGEELQTALDDVAAKNRSITQSIQYARRIQEAVFPSPELLKNYFAESFVFYRPKDIVSGDFFWFAHRQEYSVMAVADCTGHGVPGAFMSMIGNTALNQIVKENREFDPGEILNRLRNHVVTSLQLDSEGLRRTDGMDASIIAFDHRNQKLYFAGAKRPLYHVSDGKLKHYKGNFEPIGYLGEIAFKGYRTVPIEWQPGDTIYLTTDGFADQFGGPRDRKIMVKGLKDALLHASKQPMHKQRQQLDDTFWKWKGDYPQTDDILIVGLRHPNS